MAYLPVRLMGIINTNPIESTNRQIASYVLNNLEKIDFMSTGSLAEACNVSKSSISRFCRELDYEDFYHFQLDAVRYTRNFFDKFKIEKQHGKSLTESYLERVQQNVERMKATVDDTLIWKIADAIHRHENVLLFGHMQSGDIAYNLQHNLFVAGKSATVAVNPREQRALLREIKQDTVVIVFSVSCKFFECLNESALLQRNSAEVELCLVTAHPLGDIPTFVDTIINCDVDNSLAGGNLSMEMVANLIALAYQKRMA